MLLLFSLMIFSAPATTLADTPLAFLPEQHVLPQLPAIQQQAAAKQKLLLLVLGADWCHDSEALLAQFSQPEFSRALHQRYQLVFVDVGYLQFGQATAQRYQLPLYYATPTVMIIDPVNNQLLNKNDVMHWSNAASFDKAAYQQYFIDTDFKQQFASQQQQLAGISAPVLKQINQYEQQQATKLANEYQRLGPLLQAYKASGKPASTEFNQLWRDVKTFRNAILPKVQQLQQQAKTLATGEQLSL
jgi:hypothetical protein